MTLFLAIILMSTEQFVTLMMFYKCFAIDQTETFSAQNLLYETRNLLVLRNHGEMFQFLKEAFHAIEEAIWTCYCIVMYM